MQERLGIALKKLELIQYTKKVLLFIGGKRYFELLLPKPPTKAGITIKKIITKACAVIISEVGNRP